MECNTEWLLRKGRQMVALEAAKANFMKSASSYDGFLNVHVREPLDHRIVEANPDDPVDAYVSIVSLHYDILSGVVNAEYGGEVLSVSRCGNFTVH